MRLDALTSMAGEQNASTTPDRTFAEYVHVKKHTTSKRTAAGFKEKQNLLYY
jgi:hypothetical protein